MPREYFRLANRFLLLNFNYIIIYSSTNIIDSNINTNYIFFITEYNNTNTFNTTHLALSTKKYKEDTYLY